MISVSKGLMASVTPSNDVRPMDRVDVPEVVETADGLLDLATTM